ncbi:arginase family protein [Corynebacterium lubricantis]|uniref:arginase family protein n=1 Tax=Corynebacterium lubricantis TaxID=541095 RepID=UPI0003608CA5|nr:arginase family protein [Corynebacterium lubricantis]
MTEALNNTDTLRLIWPQWQGAGRDNVAGLLPELPLGVARKEYAVGAKVIQALLPDHAGPTEVVAVPEEDAEGVTDGIESRTSVLESLRNALAAIEKHDPARILTIGGECSVSVAPFAALAKRYGEDLAVVWVDSHPDIGTPDSEYPGYHAMAVALLTGHGDQAFVDKLPATVDPAKVTLAGLHDWTEDDFPNVAAWGINSFSPDDLRENSDALISWLRGTGATKVAIHFDVDTVDSNEAALGLGQVPGGLSSAEVRRVIGDLSKEADVVGLTIAEFIPRDVLALGELIKGMPLLPEEES